MQRHPPKDSSASLRNGTLAQPQHRIATEAIASLPLFESVPAALNEPDGASNLQQAGELLLPALLGDQAGTLAGQVAGRAGIPQDSAARLTQMTLPLLLSLLGRFGVNAGNVGARLGEVRGGLAQPGAAHVEPTGLTVGAPHVTAAPVFTQPFNWMK